MRNKRSSFVLILMLIFFGVCPALSPDTFDCGDVNNDNAVNIFDIAFIISYLYMGGPAPPDPLLADINNSGGIDIFDITDLIFYLYFDGDVPSCPPPMEPPYGNLVNIVDCHERGDKRFPPEEDCFTYDYDGSSTLLISHFNAGFNCCPLEIYADINIAMNQITIYEYETYDTAGPCPCMCLYLLDYEINNLPPGEYTIEIHGQCIWPEDDYLIHTIDLVSSPVGEYCLYRGYYPWEDWGSFSGD